MVARITTSTQKQKIYFLKNTFVSDISPCSILLNSTNNFQNELGFNIKLNSNLIVGTFKYLGSRVSGSMLINKNILLSLLYVTVMSKPLNETVKQ